MKIFRLEHQSKWHIVDPKDHNHSICRENYNANPKVAEAKEYADEKLCHICQSRGYKRGYLGVYPKVSIYGVHNPKRYVVLDNYEIRDFMEEAVQADRVAVMDEGQILLLGSPREVFAHRQVLLDSGLDIPQSAKLADRLQQLCICLPGDILTPDDFVSSFRAYREGKR